MASAIQSAQKTITALLSVVGDQGTQSLFGEPLIQFQIDNLRNMGVGRFLVEVDTVPGAVVALADQLRHQGISIDFVRSPQELSGKFTDDELLWVQSEGILADAALLDGVFANSSPIIATVDGREDNACFERIDLNTRWAGLALLDRKTIDGIAALPDGWNIGSSLLRQAIQDGVTQKLLRQDIVDSGQLRRIVKPEDSLAYSNIMLTKRTKQANGGVESVIFGPIVRRLAPLLWPFKSREIVIDGAAIGTGLASAGCAIFGFGIAAASLATVSIFILTLRYCLHHSKRGDAKSNMVTGISWSILAATFAALLWKEAQGSIPLIFPAIVVIGLLYLTHQTRETGMVRFVKPSPAMVTIVMGFSAFIGNVGAGAMLIAIVQLAFLITGKTRSTSQ